MIQLAGPSLTGGQPDLAPVSAAQRSGDQPLTAAPPNTAC